MYKVVLWTVALAMLTGSSLARAGDKKPAQPTKEIFKVEDKLTEDDPADTKFKESKQKVHSVKLEAGKYLRIDLSSKDFDTYLRLQDEKGKSLAENDDISQDNLNSRIVYKITTPGTYKLVVTSFDTKVGAYKLTVAEASRAEILVAEAAKLPTMGKEARGKLLAELTKFYTDKGDGLEKDDVQTIFTTCLTLERVDAKQAAQTYHDFSGILAKSSDKEFVKVADKLMGCSRRLNLPGQEMAVKGTKMDGEAVDWKSYRGKVVLVDFWATWCGPCVREIPNMKKNLEAYKERGFEIVGVSIDQDRTALEKFLEKEKLPWICLHDKGAGNGHPLAEHYGVMFIPLAILVDRDGKVVSLNARGSELDRLLEKLIGPVEKEKKDK